MPLSNFHDQLPIKNQCRFQILLVRYSQNILLQIYYLNYNLFGESLWGLLPKCLSRNSQCKLWFTLNARLDQVHKTLTKNLQTKLWSVLNAARENLLKTKYKMKLNQTNDTFWIVPEGDFCKNYYIKLSNKIWIFQNGFL